MKALARRAVRTRQSSVALVFVGSWLVASMVGGCRSQSEGQRCDTANGSADCEEGLVCIDKGSYPFCCPPPGQPISAAICNAGTPQPEAGPTEDAGAEAAPDTAPPPDGGADVNGEAMPDAAEEPAPDTSVEPPDSATE